MRAPSPRDSDGPDLSLDLCLAAASDIPVLISAAPDHDIEVTRAIHGRSVRSARGLVIVRCCDDVDGTVFENGVTLPSAAELAAGGTLLIRDVDRLSPASQNELLARLMDRAASDSGSQRPAARIVAATSVSLHERVMAGGFSEDLFYRLNVLHLRLPLDAADWHFDVQDDTMDETLGRRRIVLDLPDGMTTPEPLPPPVRGRVLEFVPAETLPPRPVPAQTSAPRTISSARAHRERESFGGRLMRSFRNVEARLFEAVEHAFHALRSVAGRSPRDSRRVVQ